LLDRLTDSWGGAVEFIEENDANLAEAIRTGQVVRLRYASPHRVAPVVREAAAESLQFIADTSTVLS
jgi:hypothetical protein